MQRARLNDLAICGGHEIGTPLALRFRDCHWAHLDPFGFILVHLDPFGSIPFGSILGPIWIRVGPVGIQLDTFGSVWTHVGSIFLFVGPMWD